MVLTRHHQPNELEQPDDHGMNRLVDKVVPARLKLAWCVMTRFVCKQL